LKIENSFELVIKFQTLFILIVLSNSKIHKKNINQSYILYLLIGGTIPGSTLILQNSDNCTSDLATSIFLAVGLMSHGSVSRKINAQMDEVDVVCLVSPDANTPLLRIVRPNREGSFPPDMAAAASSNSANNESQLDSKEKPSLPPLELPAWCGCGTAAAK
jgi:hypothetical protein